MDPSTDVLPSVKKFFDEIVAGESKIPFLKKFLNMMYYAKNAVKWRQQVIWEHIVAYWREHDRETYETLPSFWIGFHIGKRGIAYAMLIGFVWPLLFQLHRVFLYWQFTNEFSPGFGMDFSDYLELPVVLLYSALAGYLGAKIAQRMTRLKYQGVR